MNERLKSIWLIPLLGAFTACSPAQTSSRNEVLEAPVPVSKGLDEVLAAGNISLADAARSQQASIGTSAGLSDQASASLVITLEDAIRRAQSVEHGYVSAVVDKGTAEARKTIARADLLPNAVFHNQALYTQPQRPYTVAGSANAATGNGGPLPIFIANNSVREYVSQGVVTETVGLGRVAELRRADAEALAAKLRLEVARRGLVQTVVGAYYGLVAAQDKARVTQRALDESNRFLTLTRQLEAGGEVAKADVLKAQLEQRTRERESQDASLEASRAQLELGVLLFPDPASPYTLASDLNAAPSLPTRAELEDSAKTSNPDVRAAIASLQAADRGVTAGQAAYLPDLSLAYNYGIDSDHFSATDANGIRNLGYAVTASLDIPIWDWFATHAKVKQGKLQRDLAKADLTIAQRRLIAAFEEFYAEAELAGRQMVSLDRNATDATEALRLTTARYGAGEGTVLEVVDAQNTLVTAESARVDGAVRYYMALASLQTLTGNLP